MVQSHQVLDDGHEWSSSCDEPSKLKAIPSAFSVGGSSPSPSQKRLSSTHLIACWSCKEPITLSAMCRIGRWMESCYCVCSLTGAPCAYLHVTWVWQSLPFASAYYSWHMACYPISYVLPRKVHQRAIALTKTPLPSYAGCQVNPGTTALQQAWILSTTFFVYSSFIIGKQFATV